MPVGVMSVYVGWGLDGNREEREIYRVSFTLWASQGAEW